MSTTAEALYRAYSVHGVNIEVLADDPAVIRAMELRFSSFGAVLDPTKPSLTFEVVSGEPSPAPDSVGRPVYETPHGSLHYFPEEDLLAGELGGVALHCDAANGRARIVAPSFRARTLYFATHPVTTVALMELMERRGHYSLHAGCLADTSGHGLLLSGPSGAGKSTLTLALASGGMEFLGDDVVFITGSDPSLTQPPAVRALGFADALGLGAFASRLFPALASLPDQLPAEGFPKRLLRSEEILGRPAAISCEPRVIVFPEVDADRPSAVAPLDRGDALLRLVPDVLVTHPDATQAHIAAIADLLGQVRCYSVQSGYDLERAAELVRALV